MGSLARPVPQFNASSIPTLLVLDRGRVKARQVGAVPADALLRWVEAAA